MKEIKERVLVIGNDPKTRLQRAADLEALGYTARIVEGPLPEGERYDTVVADLSGENGFSMLCDAVARGNPGATIIVALTNAKGARSMGSFKVEALRDPSGQALDAATLARLLAAKDPRPGRFQAPQAFDGIIHASAEMAQTLRLVSLVAPTDTVVLIQGESGTGKELVARAIHRNSLVRTGPFVPVNCGAIPEGLLENELFGHVRGSYTGAQDNKRGLFEFANAGTLFLDEISETSPGLQVKLLRAIEQSEIRRLGDTYPIKVSCRIVTAANKNLAQLVSEGRFREDLYYRLNVFPILVPPLRDRPADIRLLADYFLHKIAKHLGRPRLALSPEAAQALEARPWPGNVRELQHFMERVALLSTGSVIELEDLPRTSWVNKPQKRAPRRPRAKKRFPL